jgi:hypothetical protein
MLSGVRMYATGNMSQSNEAKIFKKYFYSTIMFHPKTTGKYLLDNNGQKSWI